MNDKYSNIAMRAVTQTVLNTLTYSKFDFGVGILEKVGLIIHRIDIEFQSTNMVDLASAGDSITVALVTTNVPTSISSTVNSTIDLFKIAAAGAGTSQILETVYAHDFSNFPGGGLIVAPSSLYAALVTSGLGAMATIVMKLHFSILEMKSDEYYELMQARAFYG